MIKKKRKTKLRNKILYSYLALIILVVFFAYILFYIHTSKILLSHAKSSTWNGINQAAEFINYKFSGTKDTSSIIYLDEDFPRIVDQFKKEQDDFKKYQIYNQLTQKVTTVATGRDVYSVRLYIDHDLFTSNSANKILSEKNIYKESWYQKVIAERGGIVWIPTYNYNYDSPRDEQTIVSIARGLYSNGRRYGIVVVDILEQTIFDVLKEVSITQQGSVFIMDEDGFIISSNNRDRVGDYLSDQKLMDVINVSNKGEINVKVNDVDSVTFHREIPNTNWSLVVVIPTSEILSESKTLTNFMIIILAFIIAITAYISLRISNGVTYRLEDLSENMKKIQNDEWDINMKIDSYDEVGDLQRSFAYMVQNMQVLINEKYQSEIDIKQAELRALQAQINPHFLYNILDMINWMALKHGADDINYIVARLAKFFRLSLQSGKEMVRVQDEIDHIQLYIDIQNKRMGDDIEMILEIDDEILHYPTIKLILQPLIENAIIHGIMESDNKRGFVKIRGFIEHDIIIIEIEDNGVGMSQETIDSILNNQINGSYGVRNVNERIQLKFGNEYGLNYKSILGKGTIVRVSFPAIESQD